jgi:hypothetical protein
MYKRATVVQLITSSTTSNLIVLDVRRYVAIGIEISRSRNVCDVINFGHLISIYMRVEFSSIFES